MERFDIFILTFLVTFIFTFLVITRLDDNMWEQKAVNHGAAHYDSQTGKFTWNTEEKK